MAKERTYLATWTVNHSALITARDDEEAAEKFAASAYTEEDEEMSEWEVVEACATCKQPEDQDGRCGCTNPDAFGY